MSIFERLGELIGNAFRALFDSISGLLKFKPSQLEDVNKEIAGASLDPEKFKTKEVKDLAKAIKERLKTSPTGPADWIQSIMGDFMVKIWDVAVSIMLPSKMETFEDAKASATWLTSLIADFVVLSAALDIAGTAFSATLVRNLIHIFRLFAATFGMDRYMSAVIAPALGASIVPRLEQGYNAQYQTAIPGTGDLIRMAVREAFTPEIAEKFGQYEDFPEAVVEWLERGGLSRDWAERHWAAHWDLPGATLGYEMLHRGVIDDETLKMLLRALDVMPFWRDKLIAISWNVPTRVDIRRFLDMGTIDETRLRELYTNIGYHGKDLEDYVLWTKVYNTLPDLIARWQKGWLTIDDVRSTLTGLGMPAARVEELIQTKVKAAEPERVEEGKALTKAEIYKGVKQGFITREEGIELLMDLNYNRAEAEYLMDINVAVLAGSPEMFADFKDITQKYKMATGKEEKPVPEELKRSAAEVVRLTKEIESLLTAVKEEKAGLIEEEVLPEKATERLKQLQVALHRAEAELARAKSAYDEQLAIYRHR